MGNARGTRFVSPVVTAAIIVVSLVLVALFVGAAVLGNRAQTRLTTREPKPDEPD